MGAHGGRTERTADFVPPQGYEVLGIGEILTSKPKPGRSIALSQVIPVRGLKIPHRPAHDKLCGRSEKKDPQEKLLISSGE